MPTLPTQLMLATSYDERFPPSEMLEPNMKSYFLSTGMYPQELILNFANDSAANITKMNLVCHGVKKLRVERCVEKYATVFEAMVDCELQMPQEGQLQRETYQINKTTVGQGVRFLKVILGEG